MIVILIGWFIIPWLPVCVELLLVSMVVKPVKYHIYSAQVALLGVIVYEPNDELVSCLHLFWWFYIVYLMQCCADAYNVLDIKK